MKHFWKYVGIVCIVLAQTGCVKDLQDDVNAGGWNHERSITGITFENQVGTAVIETVSDTEGTVEVSINIAAVPDLSAVKIDKLELSYQATASVQPGDVLNFENESRSASIVVTATTGEQREYVVTVSEFMEDLVGTYDVTGLMVYAGTGPEYGGAAVMALSDKPWCWSEIYGPQVECDNVLTFTMTDISEEGNTSGICVNDAGIDGKYADFIFLGSGNKENPGVDIDLAGFYRQIPVGESKWERDYAANTLSFIDKDGRRTTGTLQTAGTEDLGNGLSMTIDNQAFSFTLSGTDDWTNIYSDYDKFVKNPRRLWVLVTKR